MSRPPRRQRLAAAALALAIVLSGCTKAEPVTYLIPDGYVGFVTVVFNQPAGKPERREDGRRIYVIPANGLLVSQFSGPNEGRTDETYAYVRPDGSRAPITAMLNSTLHDTPENRATAGPIIYRREMSGMNADGTMIEQCVVGTKAQILDLDFFQEGKRVDSLVAARGIVLGTVSRPVVTDSAAATP